MECRRVYLSSNTFAWTNGTTSSPTEGVVGYDVATNTATTTLTFTTDDTAPTSSVLCNGGACSSNYYKTNVTVAITAADTGGAGVKEIIYTTDGSTPTAAGGGTTTTVLGTTAGPVVSTESASNQVKWLAIDNVGNVSSVTTQTIKLDKTAPTQTITLNSPSTDANAFHKSHHAA